MSKNTYSNRLQPLLRLGKLKRTQQRIDYAARFKLTNEDELELLLMAEDRDLNFRKPQDPAVWAPIHAVRALAQVGTINMIEPLFDLLDVASNEDDDWMAIEIPRTLATLGKAAFTPVEGFLVDISRDEWARNQLACFYSECYDQHPALRGALIDNARKLLADFNRHDPIFNGFLVSELMHLHAVEALPTIRMAFNGKAVETDICGEYEDVEANIHHNSKLANS